MSVEVRNYTNGLKHENVALSSKRNLHSKYDKENSFQNEASQDEKSFNHNIDERNLPEDILMLEEHQAICEREGRYVEAEIDKNRIAELRAQLDMMRREELMQAHMQEKQKIEEEQINEFSEFNEFWDRKMEEFNEQASAIEEQMILRHQEELGKFLEELELSLPVKPKDSAELLNLRKIQQTLAKQKDYIEAHKVQQRCIKLEREEAEKWHAVKEQKMKNQKAQLEHKQLNELNAIRKRIATGQEEQRKARSLDLERLLHKYQNIRKDLSVRQQNELLQISKPAKTSGSIFGSTYKSQSKLNTSTNSMYKYNSKMGDAPKRQPLHETSNLQRKNMRPLQEKKKNF